MLFFTHLLFPTTSQITRHMDDHDRKRPAPTPSRPESKRLELMDIMGAMIVQQLLHAQGSARIMGMDLFSDDELQNVLKKSLSVISGKQDHAKRDEIEGIAGKPFARSKEEIQGTSRPAPNGGNDEIGDNRPAPDDGRSNDELMDNRAAPDGGRSNDELGDNRLAPDGGRSNDELGDVLAQSFNVIGGGRIDEETEGSAVKLRIPPIGERNNQEIFMSGTTGKLHAPPIGGKSDQEIAMSGTTSKLPAPLLDGRSNLEISMCGTTGKLPAPLLDRRSNLEISMCGTTGKLPAPPLGERNNDELGNISMQSLSLLTGKRVNEEVERMKIPASSGECKEEVEGTAGRPASPKEGRRNEDIGVNGNTRKLLTPPLGGRSNDELEDLLRQSLSVITGKRVKEEISRKIPAINGISNEENERASGKMSTSCRRSNEEVEGTAEKMRAPPVGGRSNEKQPTPPLGGKRSNEGIAGKPTAPPVVVRNNEKVEVNEMTTGKQPTPPVTARSNAGQVNEEIIAMMKLNETTRKQPARPLVGPSDDYGEQSSYRRGRFSDRRGRSNDRGGRGNTQIGINSMFNQPEKPPAPAPLSRINERIGTTTTSNQSGKPPPPPTPPPIGRINDQVGTKLSQPGNPPPPPTTPPIGRINDQVGTKFNQSRKPPPPLTPPPIGRMSDRVGAVNQSVITGKPPAPPSNGRINDRVPMVTTVPPGKKWPELNGAGMFMPSVEAKPVAANVVVVPFVAKNFATFDVVIEAPFAKPVVVATPAAKSVVVAATLLAKPIVVASAPIAKSVVVAAAPIAMHVVLGSDSSSKPVIAVPAHIAKPVVVAAAFSVKSVVADPAPIAKPFVASFAPSAERITAAAVHITNPVVALATATAAPILTRIASSVSAASNEMTSESSTADYPIVVVDLSIDDDDDDAAGDVDDAANDVDIDEHAVEEDDSIDDEDKDAVAEEAKAVNARETLNHIHNGFENLMTHLENLHFLNADWHNVENEGLKSRFAWKAVIVPMECARYSCNLFLDSLKMTNVANSAATCSKQEITNKLLQSLDAFHIYFSKQETPLKYKADLIHNAVKQIVYDLWYQPGGEYPDKLLPQNNTAPSLGLLVHCKRYESLTSRKQMRDLFNESIVGLNVGRPKRLCVMLKDTLALLTSMGAGVKSFYADYPKQAEDGIMGIVMHMHGKSKTPVKRKVGFAFPYEMGIKAAWFLPNR